MTVRSLKDAVIKVMVDDDGGSPGSTATATVSIEEGDLSYTERSPVNIISDRGVLDHARSANEEPIDVSFTVMFESFQTEATPTVYEALKKIGSASAWVSQESDSDAYAVRIQFELTDPGSGTDDETVKFDPFFPEEVQFQEGDPSDTMSVSGRARQTSPTLS